MAGFFRVVSATAGWSAEAHMIDCAVEAAVHRGRQRLPRIDDSWRRAGAVASLRIQLHPMLQLRRAMPTSAGAHVHGALLAQQDLIGVEAKGDQ
jgi:hypothetical protein